MLCDSRTSCDSRFASRTPDSRPLGTVPFIQNTLSRSLAKPNGVSKRMAFKMASFWFLQSGMLVPVYFGSRFGVSLAAPKGVSKRMVFTMASLKFWVLTNWSLGSCLFWCPLIMECFRGRAQRGAQFYFIFAVLQTLFSCRKTSLVYLKSCTPMKGTPWSTAGAWVSPRSSCSGLIGSQGWANLSFFRVFGEIGKGCDCNTCRGNPHLKHVWNIASHELLQTNYCTLNSRKNALPWSSFPCFLGKRQGKPPKKNKDFSLLQTPKVLWKEGKNDQKSKEFLAKEEKKEKKIRVASRPLQIIASHELLHERARQKATIAATPLPESTPSPNTQVLLGRSLVRAARLQTEIAPEINTRNGFQNAEKDPKNDPKRLRKSFKPLSRRLKSFWTGTFL